MNSEPTKIMVAILVISDNTGHYVAMSCDGHETDRWGPFTTRDVAMLIAGRCGDIAKETANQAAH